MESIFIVNVIIVFLPLGLAVITIENCAFSNTKHFEIFEKGLNCKINGVIHASHMHCICIPFNSLLYKEKMSKGLVHLIVVESIVGGDAE